jgi:hypothetical protein
MKQCKLKIAEQGLKKNLKSPEMEIVAQELEKKRKAEGGQNTVVRFAGLEIHSQRIERYLHRKKRAKGEGEKHSDISKSKS